MITRFEIGPCVLLQADFKSAAAVAQGHLFECYLRICNELFGTKVSAFVNPRCIAKRDVKSNLKQGLRASPHSGAHIFGE